MSEKTEIESLFLEGIDEQKREFVRKKMASGKKPLRSDVEQMIESVCMNKDTLIACFDMIFGSEALSGPKKIVDKQNAKKLSILSGIDNSMSYLSNATTAAAEFDRFQ